MHKKPLEKIGNCFIALFVILFIACSPLYENTAYAEEIQTITEEEVPMAAQPASSSNGIIILIAVMSVSGIVAGYVMNIRKNN